MCWWANYLKIIIIIIIIILIIIIIIIIIIMSITVGLTIYSHRERLMRTWITIYNTNTPGLPCDTKKSVWDRPGIMADQAVVMSAFIYNFNRARLLAASAPHSGVWLSTPSRCQHAG